jgi:hypothetical protein
VVILAAHQDGRRVVGVVVEPDDLAVCADHAGGRLAQVAGVHRAGALVERQQVGVGREVVGVAERRDARRAAEVEAVVAQLHTAGHQLDRQQAVGHIPLAVRVGGRVVDLHAALIEILDRALALGRLDIVLAQRLADGRRAPCPRAVADLLGHRAILALPDPRKGGIADRRRG